MLWGGVGGKGGKEENKETGMLCNICVCAHTVTLVDAKVGVLKSLSEVDAIGHRVLHGGSTYTQPIVVNDAVKEGIRKCIVLGPLHNPANLGGGFFTS